MGSCCSRGGSTTGGQATPDTEGSASSRRGTGSRARSLSTGVGARYRPGAHAECGSSDGLGSAFDTDRYTSPNSSKGTTPASTPACSPLATAQEKRISLPFTAPGMPIGSTMSDIPEVDSSTEHSLDSSRTPGPFARSRSASVSMAAAMMMSSPHRAVASVPRSRRRSVVSTVSPRAAGAQSPGIGASPSALAEFISDTASDGDAGSMLQAWQSPTSPSAANAVQYNNSSPTE